LEHVFSLPAVLTEPLPQRRRRRPLSPRQEYEEFILQRIEDYKNQLSREQILALGDEAVRELEVGPEGQLLLTEVLMLEHVDRLITRRLRLPTFRRWRERHSRMRKAQRELTHWGLPADLPLAALAERLEDHEAAVVIGAAAAGAAFYLAAHDVMALIIAESLPGVEAIETRAAQEALAGRVQALVVALGDWFPDVEPALAVVDPTVVATLEAPARVRAMDALRERTVHRGVHLILPVEQRAGVRSLAPEALLAHYAGWQVERGPRPCGRWFLAIKP
jgi:hypothetical protein